MSEPAFPTRPVGALKDERGAAMFYGMAEEVTKREYYVTSAMAAIINRLGVTTTEAEVIARMAFQMADAMIKESER